MQVINSCRGFSKDTVQGVPQLYGLHYYDAISTSMNFRPIGIILVLVECLPDCYVVKLGLVEIGYVA